MRLWDACHQIVFGRCLTTFTSEVRSGYHLWLHLVQRRTRSVHTSNDLIMILTSRYVPVPNFERQPGPCISIPTYAEAHVAFMKAVPNQQHPKEKHASGLATEANSSLPFHDALHAAWTYEKRHHMDKYTRVHICSARLGASRNSHAT